MIVTDPGDGFLSPLQGAWIGEAAGPVEFDQQGKAGIVGNGGELLLFHGWQRGRS